jgi:hypothetical protein
LIFPGADPEKNSQRLKRRWLFDFKLQEMDL